MHGIQRVKSLHIAVDVGVDHIKHTGIGQVRFNGSHEEGVRNTASIPNAAADRKMAPIFVVSTTPSMMTVR